jgi:beta-phosphoglucomutase
LCEGRQGSRTVWAADRFWRSETPSPGRAERPGYSPNPAGHKSEQAVSSAPTSRSRSRRRRDRFAVTATFFDFDGVLVDSEPVHLAAFNDVLVPHGVAIDADRYVAEYLSLDDAGVFRAAFLAAGRSATEHDVQSLVEAKTQCFLARFEKSFRVFPGAAELVVRRAARGPVAIVSGALEREIVFALDKMRVRRAVSFIVSAERTTASKPDPAPYRLALDELRALAGGSDPTSPRAVVVEDSLGGVTSAKRAGLRCVAIAHSYAASELLAAGADAVAADVASLTDALLEGDA